MRKITIGIILIAVLLASCFVIIEMQKPVMDRIEVTTVAGGAFITTDTYGHSFFQDNILINSSTARINSTIGMRCSPKQNCTS